jgi:transcriptional regulator with XRE-family HTH domain
MNSFEIRLKKVMGSLSVRKFAEVLGAPTTTVQQYLKGRTPPADFIVLVCERFKVDSWWLLTGEEKTVVAEPTCPYHHSPVSTKINQMLDGMDEEAQRDVLKYTEKTKLLADLMAERQGNTKG